MKNELSKNSPKYDPPKNKLNKSGDVIVNKQDDNSYEEEAPDKPQATPLEAEKEHTNRAKNDMEYEGEGEFENDDPNLSDTNPKDDYL